jgi:hypothetical protein
MRMAGARTARRPAAARPPTRATISPVSLRCFIGLWGGVVLCGLLYSYGGGACKRLQECERSGEMVGTVCNRSAHRLRLLIRSSRSQDSRLATRHHEPSLGLGLATCAAS